MTTVPYPAEIRVVPRKRRVPVWVYLLAVVALVVSMFTWPLRLQPQHATTRQPTTHVTHQVTHPAPVKAGVTVTVNGAAYACSVVPKKHR